MMKQYFLQEEDGQGMVEVALIISLVALAAIGASKVLGQGVLAFYFNKVVNAIEAIFAK